MISQEIFLEIYSVQRKDKNMLLKIKIAYLKIKIIKY